MIRVVALNLWLWPFGNANGLQSPMVRASAAEQEEVGEPLVPGIFIGKAMTSGVSTQKKPLTYYYYMK